MSWCSWVSPPPGVPHQARHIGLFRMRDEKGPHEKILRVPLKDPMWSHVRDLPDVNPAS